MSDAELTSSERDDQQQHAMNRRRLLLGMGAAASIVSGGMALGVAHAAGKHDHSKHKPRHAGLLEAVNDCVDKGRRCIAHCLVVFQEGDLKLADCARKVHEMKAVCDAFSYLLTANSEYSKEFSGICSKRVW